MKEHHEHHIKRRNFSVMAARLYEMQLAGESAGPAMVHQCAGCDVAYMK
jgi:hypothetical protein